MARTARIVIPGRTHLRYTQYINRLHNRTGHLWQNRFFFCPLEPGHLLAALRYIERNPVRAQMLRAPWRYPWSSAAVHCGDSEDSFDLLDPAAAGRPNPGAPSSANPTMKNKSKNYPTHFQRPPPRWRPLPRQTRNKTKPPSPPPPQRPTPKENDKVNNYDYSSNCPYIIRIAEAY